MTCWVDNLWNFCHVLFTKIWEIFRFSFFKLHVCWLQISCNFWNIFIRYKDRKKRAKIGKTDTFIYILKVVKWAWVKINNCCFCWRKLRHKAVRLSKLYSYESNTVATVQCTSKKKSPKRKFGIQFFVLLTPKMGKNWFCPWWGQKLFFKVSFQLLLLNKLRNTFCFRCNL